jgi:(1->4)-alpha-D-glucan 1-alpha-D-glucosylmutase
VGTARSHAKGSDRSIFDFIEAVLLCKESVATDKKRRHEILEFTRKFQQVTAPVTAKSVEDTAFYRYNRLLAVNEVGGDPRSIGTSTAALHRSVIDKLRRWPHSMLSTSTHDSKRGEDARFRLCVLTELPKQWRAFANKVARLNRSKRGDWQGNTAPSLNDEYLLLQTIAGIWPVNGAFDFNHLLARLKNYAVKAVREAKVQSSWIDPDQDYENAFVEFIDGLGRKPRRERFESLLREFIEPIAFFGVLNSIAALVCKLTMPGVPDFYQGSEFTELTLVDPDNRGLIDFEARATACERLSDPPAIGIPAWIGNCLHERRYDELKLFIIRQLLQVRRESVELFASGDYVPLDARGVRADHVCAFTRTFGSELLLVIVARWAATLVEGRQEVPVGEEIWGDTAIQLPDALKRSRMQDVLYGTAVSELGDELPLSRALRVLPVAVYKVSLPAVTLEPKLAERV